MVKLNNPSILYHHSPILLSSPSSGASGSSMNLPTSDVLHQVPPIELHLTLNATHLAPSSVAGFRGFNPATNHPTNPPNPPSTHQNHPSPAITTAGDRPFRSFGFSCSLVAALLSCSLPLLRFLVGCCRFPPAAVPSLSGL